MFVKICSNFNGQNLFRPCGAVVRKFFPFQVAGKIHSDDRRSVRLSTLPVQETAGFRFAKPESSFKNRLKEEASLTQPPHARLSFKLSTTPLRGGEKNTWLG
jgi:hypothetical protein